jgi:hypothetical protein
MSVTMFAGTLVGTLLAVAAQNRKNPICKFFFGLHPLLAKLIGLVVVFAFVLIPAMVLSGDISITNQEFFWGGCFAYSAIISFTIAGLTIHPHVHTTHKAHAH